MFDYLKENNDLPTLYRAINTLNEIGNGQVVYLLKTVPFYKKVDYCEIEMLVGQEFVGSVVNVFKKQLCIIIHGKFSLSAHCGRL